MVKSLVKSSLLHLSVEEENLAAIPFAVLERRVGKQLGKMDIRGAKILPDGTEMTVSWQVQGNSELGLPTEQDLDIFVALGVLTFRANFSKTVTFSGREIARILGIASVHGKFYKRLKLAMDRFIPLRFRAIAESERQEDVKWLNVFQEASFTLEKQTGRCTGSITWTDKLIQSMNSGFFRVLDAGRYMELDGLTGKHLYRFLAVAFEFTDIVIIDARKLATEHLGIINPPKYFSRLMQTLEPAFEQLIRVQVLGAYHVVQTERWEVALHRHASYVPERKTLLQQDPEESRRLRRACCQSALEHAGFSEKIATSYVSAASDRMDFYQLDRAAHLLESLTEEGVAQNVAQGLIRRALDQGPGTSNAIDLLDVYELACDVCHQKKASGQTIRNPAGLIVKLARNAELRDRTIPEEVVKAAIASYRRRERAMMTQEEQAEKRALVFEYERFCDQLADSLFNELSEAARQNFRREKAEVLRQQGRLDRLEGSLRDQEIDRLVRQELVRREAPPFEKWYLRKRVRQAVLPFEPGEAQASAS
jgi:hypothetical protein